MLEAFMRYPLALTFLTTLAFAAGFLSSPSSLMAHDGPHGADASKRAVAAASTFLDSLNPEQHKQALLEFDSAKKPNWSNLPTTFVPRNGVKLGDLTAEQRVKAIDVLGTVLSKE